MGQPCPACEQTPPPPLPQAQQQYVEPYPPPPPLIAADPFYKKWWFWAIVGVGTVGLGATVIALTRRDKGPVSYIPIYEDED
jgi:hypothetical protein